MSFNRDGWSGGQGEGSPPSGASSHPQHGMLPKSEVQPGLRYGPAGGPPGGGMTNVSSGYYSSGNGPTSSAPILNPITGLGPGVAPSSAAAPSSRPPPGPQYGLPPMHQVNQQSPPHMGRDEPPISRPPVPGIGGLVQPRDVGGPLRTSPPAKHNLPGDYLGDFHNERGYRPEAPRGPHGHPQDTSQPTSQLNQGPLPPVTAHIHNPLTQQSLPARLRSPPPPAHMVDAANHQAHVLSHMSLGPPYGGVNASQAGAPMSRPNEQAAAQLAGGGQGKPLNVKDALGYLDQVKNQFSDRPDVYNRFLDIMKDFKSQAIDTPGVIERVSSLFAGHPSLIQGFNTFLPQGYRIECSADPMDPRGTITVTTPQGTLVSTGGSGLTVRVPPPTGGPPGGTAFGSILDTLNKANEPNANASSANFLRPMSFGAPPQPPPPVNAQPPIDAGLGGLDSAGLAGAGMITPGIQSAAAGVNQLQSAAAATQVLPGQDPKRGPVEFNHAISYVNKIKNRFSNQPEIYKNFLEILQTYQRESKPIQDVYAQVTSLFADAPDLLEDFKQFLPESAAQARAQAARQQSQMAQQQQLQPPNDHGAFGNAQAPLTPGASRLPPVGNFAPPPSAPSTKDTSVVSGQKKRKGAQTLVGSIPLQESAMRSTQQTGNKRQKNHHGRAYDAQQPVSPTLFPPLPQPVSPPSRMAATQEEMAFFDRVRKWIGNKQTYNEFLKVLNLFSQEVIDRQTLISKAESFIGNSRELFLHFKSYVNINVQDERDGYKVLQNKPQLTDGKVKLSTCRAYGPSYRMLPQGETQRECSGRDEMCREVLNDVWASHPTWASEDSGFIAHRKNTYEETLHRIEEERHDYDLNIEANMRTIQLLEPIAQRINSMTVEERQTFRLPPGLGGASKTIYQRIIKKVYERPAAQQVIEGLHSAPAAVVPIVLRRLKQKDEEWRLAQREWNKIWRDGAAKAFWKSLDHQGLNIKGADKKLMTGKGFIHEIQAKYKEQANRKLNPNYFPQQYQYVYPMQDQDVILDITKLLSCYMEAATTPIHEREKIETFVKDFVSLVFDVPKELVRNSMVSPRVTNGDDMDIDEGSGGEHRYKKAQREDLRRGLLRKPNRSRKEKEGSTVPGSGASTPDNTDPMDEDGSSRKTPNQRAPAELATPEKWLLHKSVAAHPASPAYSHSAPKERHVYNLFCSNNIYNFLRLFQTTYSRFKTVKDAEQEVAADVRGRMEVEIAHDLQLLTHTPDRFFTDVGPGANYYSQAMEHCEKFLENDLDANTFEEGLRTVYSTRAWALYSVDKLMSNMAKTALSMQTNDDKALELYAREREQEVTDNPTQIAYRKQVEGFLQADDYLFRIAWDTKASTASVQLLMKDDMTNDAGASPAERWRNYIDTFTLREPTEGVAEDKIVNPFLKRSLPNESDVDSVAEQADEPGVEMDPGLLRYKIDVKSFKMFFQEDTNESWKHPEKKRKRGLGELDEARDKRAKRFDAEYGDDAKWARDEAEEQRDKDRTDFDGWYPHRPAKAAAEVDAMAA